MVRADTVALTFPGKSHQEWSSEIRDEDLATIVHLLKRRGGRARLLAFKERGKWHPLNPSEINDYVRERTGGEFTAKDFRTLHGTAAAASSLASHGTEEAATKRKKALAQAMRDAAAVLGNTPSIAKSSYVDPRVVDRYEHGLTVDPGRPAAVESELRALLYD